MMSETIAVSDNIQYSNDNINFEKIYIFFTPHFLNEVVRYYSALVLYLTVGELKSKTWSNASIDH